MDMPQQQLVGSEGFRGPRFIRGTYGGFGILQYYCKVCQYETSKPTVGKASEKELNAQPLLQDDPVNTGNDRWQGLRRL